jgi:Flp pilus assembly protein TadG
MSARQLSGIRRDGAIAVELAVLLPLVMFMAVIGVDYARIFSRALILETASRNGCIYATLDSDHAADTASITAVTMRDLTDTSPTPTVIVTRYTGSDGWAYVQVKVQQHFKTVTRFPGVPSDSTLSRTTDMRVCPKTPKPGTYANY